MFQGSFNGISRKFQGCFKEVSRVSQESVKEVSKEIAGSFMGISKKFKGCFKEVSKVFQGSSKEVSIMGSEDHSQEINGEVVKYKVYREKAFFGIRIEYHLVLL